MRPDRALLLARLGVGGLYLVSPRPVARLLGQTQPTTAERTVLRLLGAREMAQALALRQAGGPVLAAGAGVDLLHAATALLYARTPRGHTAGRRSATLAGVFAIAQLAVAATAKRRANTRTAEAPLPTRPPAPEPKVWVDSARSPVWPSPAEAQAPAQVLVGEPAERTVQLHGGVMDGAVIVAAPGQRTYTVHDSDHGSTTYEQATDTGRADGDVFVLVQPPAQ